MDYFNIAFDRTEIAQSELNIENKKRSNLLKWNGQFSPQFIEILLKYYSKPGYKVLEPFTGSGTVLYESGRKGIETTGIELNPAAYYLSKIYEYINIDESQRIEFLYNLEQILHDLNIDSTTSKDKIIEIFLNKRNELDKNSKIYELLTIFIVLMDFNNKLDYKVLLKKWDNFKSIVLQLPFYNNEIKVFNQDARKTDLVEDTFDLVITSPPYINVYNYHQQYRKSMEMLGFNLLEVAKSEVGSNRKYRSNRFLTVIQYCLDIALVLKELSRVCKKDSRIIFVVGRESNVRKISFLNSKIVYLIATECLEMKLIKKQERVFKNRYGQLIYEDILHFMNNKKCDYKDLIKIAREIAKTALQDAVNRASGDVLDDINSALEKLEEVNPSMIYECKE